MKIIKKINNMFSEFNTIEKLLLFIAFIFCFFSMYYADITVTAQFGGVFLDSLFDLKPFSFYENALYSGVAPEGAVYDIGAYIIFGIWSLPIWLLNKLFNVSFLASGSLLWFKLLVIIFFIAGSLYLKKIIILLGVNEKNSTGAVLLYVMSFLTFFPVFVVAQYDAIAIFFMLAGFYYFLLEDNKKFVFLFAIAMIIKPFASLVYFLIIIFYDKNIWIIIKKTFAGFSLFFLCKVLYVTDPAYRESAAAFMASHTHGLFWNTFTIGIGEISYFIIVLISIYVIAYMSDINDKVAKQKMVVIFSFAIWVAFCFCVEIFPYWMIYIAPFMIIIEIAIAKNNNRTMLLGFIANVFLTLNFILRYGWVYGGDLTYSYLILKNINRHSVINLGYPNVTDLLQAFKIDQLLPITNAISLGIYCCIAFAGVKNILQPASEETINKWNYWIRLLSIYCWIIITILVIIL